MSDRDPERPDAKGDAPSEDAAKSPGGDDGAEAGGEAPQEDAAQAEAAAKAKAEAVAQAKAAAAEKARLAREAKAREEAAKPAWERDPATPEWEDADDPLARALKEELGEALLSARTYAGDLTLGVERGAVRELARSLKERHGFRLILDVCGVDYPDRDPRFEVVYHVYDIQTDRRVRFKVEVGEDEEVPSVVSVWRGADWPEREVWDMFGVRFAEHPDMTRILMWEGFEGHPLRKDFPVEGIDTGSAIYPEYYEDEAGPVAGTGTGWKPQPPPTTDE